MRSRNQLPFITLAFFLILIGAGGVLAGCGKKGRVEGEPVVAVVNGEVVTLSELEEALRPVLVDSPQLMPIETKAWEELKLNALNQLIERKILLEEARKRGIKVQESEVGDREAEIRKDYPGEEFEKMLLARLIDIDRWRETLREDLMIEKLVRASVFPPPVTEGAIQQYYQDHSSQYQISRQVRARQIVVSTEEEATEARNRILGGEDFGRVAREVSLSPDAENGGDLGFFAPGIMPPEFDRVVFSLPVGKVSSVVRSPYGYHIFRVEEIREEKTLSLEEVKEEIRDVLERENWEKAYQEWLSGLKAQASIQINKGLLEEKLQAREPTRK